MEGLLTAGLSEEGEARLLGHSQAKVATENVHIDQECSAIDWR